MRRSSEFTVEFFHKQSIYSLIQYTSEAATDVVKVESNLS